MALRKTPLREVHAERGAKFTEFGGWDMPVEFDSIREEHAAVREAAGAFDVSHMGEIEVSGPDATALMQRLTTNDVTTLEPGDTQYSMITDEDGVVLDDTVVYRMPESYEADYLFIPNAGHDAQMHDRWTRFRDEWNLEATVRNATEEYALFAVQGPDTPEQVDAVTADDARDLPRFAAMATEIAGVETFVSRTGYTGEDGYEIMCPWDDAETVWSEFEARPCGLGARDTLRIEMGFLLSGQDFDPEDEPRNPYEAGVGFTVKLDTEFVGRDALARVDEEGIEETFVGLTLLERGVARHGYDVVDDDDHLIGHVTSGTMSPTLGEPIALGYLPVDEADPGNEVGVVVRGQTKRAKVVTPPFLEDK